MLKLTPSGQVDASMQCLKMIEAYETEHSVKFDLVTRARPDLGVLTPLQPWCVYLRQPKWVHSSSKDYVFMMARPLATQVLSMITEYQKCDGLAWWKDHEGTSAPETKNRLVRTFTDCQNNTHLSISSHTV